MKEREEKKGKRKREREEKKKKKEEQDRYLKTPYGARASRTSWCGSTILGV